MSLSSFLQNILVSSALFFLLSSSALAAGCDFGTFQVGIPGIKAGQDICDFVNQGNPILGYVSILINLVTGLIILVGLISLVIAGYLYMTSGGESDGIKLAKTLVTTSLTGIVLALTAWVILNTLNPNLASQLREPFLR